MAALAAFDALVTIIATWRGAGLEPDAVTFISTARNLDAGTMARIANIAAALALVVLAYVLLRRHVRTTTAAPAHTGRANQSGS